MRKKKNYILVIIITLLATPITNIVLANNNVDACKQIMVVGDVNWPPYAIQESSSVLSDEHSGSGNLERGEAVNALPANINGIGIELVKKIFAELDIPVQVVKLDNRRNIFNGLHLGDVDILVSTYANNSIEEVVDVIKPGYLLDPVVVYMRKGIGDQINRWDDLIGKRGVTTDHFLFDTSFEEYINRYLYIHSRGDLAKVINLVNNRKADYLIGSKLQLEHGIQYAGLQNSMEMLPNVIHPETVHMGYSKTSSCRVYLPYLRKRLLDFKADGTIEGIVARYKETVVSTHTENNDLTTQTN